MIVVLIVKKNRLNVFLTVINTIIIASDHNNFNIFRNIKMSNLSLITFRLRTIFDFLNIKSVYEISFLDKENNNLFAR